MKDKKRKHCLVLIAAEALFLINQVPDIFISIKSTIATAQIRGFEWSKTLMTISDIIIFSIILISLYLLIKQRKSAFVIYYALLPVRLFFFDLTFDILIRFAYTAKSEIIGYSLYGLVFLLEACRLIYTIYCHKRFFSNPKTNIKTQAQGKVQTSEE